MAIDIKFDLIGNPEPPTIILSTRNGNKFGQLNVDEESIELVDKFNEASEISFTVHKYIDGEITYLWDKIVDFKLIYCKEWDVWFEIKVELDEATESVKTVFGTQLGQAELSQIMLYNIEINTEKDIERDDYEVGSGVLYEPLNSQCVLYRVLEKAPHYSILHVDNSLWNIQRSFSFDCTSVYDALQEIAEEIGCLFVFHSDSDANGMPRRKISVYDLQQNCRYCGYRGEAKDRCPNIDCPTNYNAGSFPNQMLVDGYGDDTSIFVTADELASNGIQLTTDTDSVKNCFKLEAGDDLMTATIRNRNPNGTDYIWYFSDATKSDMPDELVKKIEDYDKEYEKYYNSYEIDLDSDLVSAYHEMLLRYYGMTDDDKYIIPNICGFAALMEAYYNTIDVELYLKSSMMPTIEKSETNAKDQASSLSNTFAPIVAVPNLDTVSLSTANSAVLAMARTVVDSAYKVSINSSTLVDDDTWQGSFVITNYSDEEDTATSAIIQVALGDNEKLYIEQQLEKILNREDTKDLSISGLFKKEIFIDNNGKLFGEFVSELENYALNPLISFHDACQACLDILIEQGAGKDNSKKNPWDSNNNVNIANDLYESLYVPYYNKLIALEEEIAIRENDIEIVTNLQADIEKQKTEIQDYLNFEKYLGEEDWLEFCAYRREDKYSNSNYVSDGLNNAELFEKALQFYEVAKNEIFKSSELQHSISATLNNLLAIPKFEPLVKSFNVGNWIRVQIDDNIYKLRLIEYTISYKDFNNISVEFSDVSKTRNSYSDLEDILSNASSMATSYDSIKRQANLGNEARDMVRQWLNEGLDASLVQIQNNTNEDIVIDNNGLLGRSYSDITEKYSPEQIRLTHNIIAFTDDDWKSVKQAIGKHKYKYYDKGEKDFVDNIGYGVSADFVTAGVVSGSQIIGGDVYSDNYSDSNKTGSYINLRDGNFNLGGGRITFNGTELKISSPDMLSESDVTRITNDTLSTTNVVATNLQVNAGNVTGELTAATISANDITAGTIDAEEVTIVNLTMDALGSITFEDLEDSGVKIGLENLHDNTIRIDEPVLDNDGEYTYDDEGNLITKKVTRTFITSGYIESPSIHAGTLTGEIIAAESEIKAPKITGGLITGTVVEGGYIADDAGLTYIEIDTLNDGSNTSLFNKFVIKGVASEKYAHQYDYSRNYDLFSIYYNGYGRISLSGMNKAFLSIGADEKNDVIPVGEWDFSEATFVNFTNANVIGLDDTINSVMSDTITSIEENAIAAAEEAAVDAVDNALSGFAPSTIQYGNSYFEAKSGVVATNRSIRPDDSSLWLGLYSYHWEGAYIDSVYSTNLYSSDGTVKTSDRNKKKNITYGLAHLDGFFDDLHASEYEMVDGTSGRKHNGFVAQDVKDNLDKHGISTQDFAGYVSWKDEDGKDAFGLRYDEFIPLIVDQVQRLKARVTELENANI